MITGLFLRLENNLANNNCVYTGLNWLGVGHNLYNTCNHSEKTFPKVSSYSGFDKLYKIYMMKFDIENMTERSLSDAALLPNINLNALEDADIVLP